MSRGSGFVWSIITALTAAAIALPTSEQVSSSHNEASQRRASNPCAEVAATIKAAPNASEATITPSLAYACLNDVALDVNGSVTLLKSLRPFVEFQTTLPYLKDPPPEYQLPAVDILGTLDTYIAGIPNGMFQTQYEFDSNLTFLFTAAHDGHFGFASHFFSSIFTFFRPFSIVSVSEAADGAAPEIYVLSDVAMLADNAEHNLSPIRSINGQEVGTFLDGLTKVAPCQDLDAIYNQFVYSRALLGVGEVDFNSAGLFQGGPSSAAPWHFQGDTTEIKFANDSTITLPNLARAEVDFTNITSGADLFAKYGNPSATATTTATSSATTSMTSSTPEATPSRVGYPSPVMAFPENFIGGYYLPSNTDLSSDVAVLSVSSFLPPTLENQDYQNAIYDFLSNATGRDGKKQLIIDLTGNGGGSIFQAFSLFKNLFPDIYPAQNVRERATTYLDGMGTVINNLGLPALDTLTNTTELLWTAVSGLGLNYNETLNSSIFPFDSWSELYGPHTFKEDNFTSLFQVNISSPIVQILNYFEPNGFLSRANVPPNRPFPDASSIVMLTDGTCASSCSVFVDLMRELTNVKVISVGGRPMADSPMAAVGGTRGTNKWSFDVIFRMANSTSDLAGLANSTTDLGILEKTGVLQLSQDYEVLSSRGSGSINSRDLIQKGQEVTQIPAQFLYEPADCRIWYTYSSALNAVSLWEDVANIAWGNGSCAWGKVRAGQGGWSSI